MPAILTDTIVATIVQSLLQEQTSAVHQYNQWTYPTNQKAAVAFVEDLRAKFKEEQTPDVWLGTTVQLLDSAPAGVFVCAKSAWYIEVHMLFISGNIFLQLTPTTVRIAVDSFY